MPNKLRTLSGNEIVKFLEKNGFYIDGTHGSHRKMKRIINEHKQTLIIPLHKQVAKGTLHDIFRQIYEYIPEDKVQTFFYTE